MRVIPLIFSSHDPALLLLHTFLNTNHTRSDPKSFTFKFFPHIRPTTKRTTIQYRSYNTIDVDNFKSDILASPLYTKPASIASDLADQFSSTLRSILDIHAPIETITVVQRPHTPWIDPEILQAKRERSRLERCWRRWKSPFENSEPNAIQSNPLFPKPNPHFCPILKPNHPPILAHSGKS